MATEVAFRTLDDAGIQLRRIRPIGVAIQARVRRDNGGHVNRRMSRSRKGNTFTVKVIRKS